MHSTSSLFPVLQLIFVTAVTGFTPFLSSKHILHSYSPTHRGTSLFVSDHSRISFDMYKNDVSAFLQAVKRKSKQESNKSFDGAERKQVHELLDTHLHKLDGSGLASLVSSLGFIENSQREGKLCAEYFGARSETMTWYEMTSTLLGLGRTGVSWESIKDKDKIYTRLSRLLTNMDEKCTSDTFYALGLLGAKWNKMSLPLKTSIATALSKHISKINAFSLSSTLWAFAKMGLKWNELPIELQRSIPTRLLNQNKDMSPQQSSKSLWALGTMGVSFRSLPEGFLDLLIDNVNKIKRSKMGFAVPASQTLTGVAKMGVSWSDASVRMKSSLWEQVMRVSQSTNDKGIANAIWALGTIGAPMEVQPVAVRDAMFDGTLRVIDECTAWALVSIFWGLSKMGFTWMDLPPLLQQAMLTNVHRVEADMNYLDSGILLFSLGNLRAPLDTLPVGFMESVYTSTERNLYEMRPQELANCIWGLAQGGLSWDALPFKIQWGINASLRRLTNDMCILDVAHCAYGLAILAFDSTNTEDPAFRGAHQAMLSTIKISLKEAKVFRSPQNAEELEQLRIFAQYMSVYKFVLSDEEIPVTLLAASELDASANSQSRLQERVLLGVNDAFLQFEKGTDYEVVPEVSSFAGVFPVDAAIKYRGREVAFVEVDGPSHYRFDGQLKRKDKLKEAMYKKKHPHCSFHRIRYDSENKIGAEIIGSEIVEVVMKSTASSNIVEGWIKDFSADIRFFVDKGFQWSLRNSPSSTRSTK